MGVVVILSGALAAVLLITVDKNLSPEMAVGLLTGALTSTPGLSAATEAVTERQRGKSPRATESPMCSAFSASCCSSSSYRSS